MKDETRTAVQLTKSELTRYSRHLILPEVGLEGQQKLKNARVLVVGAGGLGSPCSLYLAAAGIGCLAVADFDPVELSNLQRQILYSVESVGESKAQSAANRLRGLNNEIIINTHEERLTAANAADIIGAYDIVIDGTDNFSTRYLINDACVLLKKPNVYGSIFRFEGQLSLFAPPAGPCYRCLFPEAPPPEAVPNCAEGGVLGVLAGVIGTLQATEAVKWILGIGEGLVGRLILYDALDMRFDTLKIKRDPQCPVCGENPTITRLQDEVVSCATEAVPGTPPGEISCEQLEALMREQSDIVLLDVRNNQEFALCSLPGAILIPLSELESRIGEIDRTKEIVTYCKSGLRSSKAVDILRLRGFARVRNLRGGIVQWAQEIDPSMAVY